MRIFEESEESRRIKDFLAQTKPGEVLTYKAIEAATFVKMDDSGKERLRRAIRALKLDYDCDPGIGIKMADHINGTVIVSGKLQRVRSAIGRAEKSSTRIQQKFFHLMSPEDQRRSIFVGAVFGAMNEAAKRIKREVPPTSANTKMTIPLLPSKGSDSSPLA